MTSTGKNRQMCSAKGNQIFLGKEKYYNLETNRNDHNMCMTFATLERTLKSTDIISTQHNAAPAFVHFIKTSI